MSQFSSSTHKSTLWNIVQPGDSYDIKKSMIAKMPGDSHQFMGNHLDMICVLQAAQIQRISQYLEQYKLRYRELQRRQLDRHSYEIQIKQLTQRLAQQANFKKENIKLKDFLSRQTAQLQQLRKQLSQNYNDSNLQSKYENSLLQMQSFIRELNIIKQQKRVMSIEIEQYIARIATIQTAKNRQLQQLRIYLTNNSQFAFENQKRQLILKFQSQISRLQYEISKQKENLAFKNQEIQSLQIKLSRFDQSSSSYQNEELNKRIVQFENRYAISSAQIQRLNMMLSNKNNQYNEINNKFRTLQFQYQRRQSLTKEYQIKIQNYQKQVNIFNISMRDYKMQIQNSNGYYEQKINSLNIQIEKINGILRQKVEEITSFSRRVQQYQYQMRSIQIIKRQNQQFKRKLQQTGDINRRISEYQNKIALLSQQIERLNLTLRTKNDQILNVQNRFRSTTQQIESYRRRINELQMFTHQKKQLQVRISNFQQRIIVFTRQNQDLKRRNAQLQNSLRIKIEQINLLNRNYQQQTQVMRRRINETQLSISQQFHTKISFFQQKIQIFTRENNQLQRRLNQAHMQIQRFNKDNSSLNIRINELQILRQTLVNTQTQYNRLNIDNQNLMKQIQRLNILIRNKTQEYNSVELTIRNLRNQLQNYKRVMMEMQSNISSQWHSKTTIYQQKISVFVRENDQLKRRLAEAENKIMTQLQQIERLNQLIRGKIDELNSGQNRYRNLIQQIQNYKVRINEMQSSMNHEWHSKVTFYDQNISNINRENEDLKRRLNQLTQRLNRSGSEYENKISIMSQQIQRLNITIRSKIDQGNNSQFRVRNLQQQIESLKRRIIQGQSNMNNQWRTKMAMYQQRIVSYTRQIQQLNLRLRDQDSAGRKIAEYQTKIAMLSQQLQRASYTLRIKNQQFMRLQTTYNEIRVRYEQYEIRSGRKQGQYGKLLQAYNLISVQYEKSKHHIIQYQANIKKLYSQFERLQIYVNQIRQQNTFLRRQLEQGGIWLEKNKILSLQIDRLTMLTEQQKIQLQQVRIRLSDDIALQKRINQHMALMVVLFAEIESLRKRVQDKQKECQEVRRSSLAPFKSL